MVMGSATVSCLCIYVVDSYHSCRSGILLVIVLAKQFHASAGIIGIILAISAASGIIGSIVAGKFVRNTIVSLHY